MNNSTPSPTGIQITSTQLEEDLTSDRKLREKLANRVFWFLVVWSIGLLVYWSIGLLVYWSIGLLVYWSIGLLVYWSIGLLVYWSIGLLVYWSIGLFIILMLQGFGYLNIYQSVLATLVGGTSIQIIGLVLVIVKGLFMKDRQYKEK